MSIENNQIPTIDDLIDQLLIQIDYDIYKSYKEETAEEPEFVEEDREVLREIVRPLYDEIERLNDILTYNVDEK